MTGIKTVAVAVGAFGLEVVTLLLALSATSALLIPDSIRQASHGVRLSGAVFAVFLWTLSGVGPAVLAILLSARRLGTSFWRALCLVGAFNGLVSYLFLAYTTMLNECLWNVSFPLGGNGDCGF